MVGALKMKAIMAAGEDCKQIINDFHLGEDSIELFRGLNAV